MIIKRRFSDLAFYHMGKDSVKYDYQKAILKSEEV